MPFSPSYAVSVSQLQGTGRYASASASVNLAQVGGGLLPGSYRIKFTTKSIDSNPSLFFVTTPAPPPLNLVVSSISPTEALQGSVVAITGYTTGNTTSYFDVSTKLFITDVNGNVYSPTTGYVVDLYQQEGSNPDRYASATGYVNLAQVGGGLPPGTYNVKFNTNFTDSNRLSFTVNAPPPFSMSVFDISPDYVETGSTFLLYGYANVSATSYFNSGTTVRIYQSNGTTPVTAALSTTVQGDPVGTGQYEVVRRSINLSALGISSGSYVVKYTTNGSESNGISLTVVDPPPVQTFSMSVAGITPTSGTENQTTLIKTQANYTDTPTLASYFNTGTIMKFYNSGGVNVLTLNTSTTLGFVSEENPNLGPSVSGGKYEYVSATFVGNLLPGVYTVKLTTNGSESNGVSFTVNEPPQQPQFSMSVNNINPPFAEEGTSFYLYADANVSATSYFNSGTTMRFYQSNGTTPVTDALGTSVYGDPVGTGQYETVRRLIILNDLGLGVGSYVVKYTTNDSESNGLSFDVDAANNGGGGVETPTCYSGWYGVNNDCPCEYATGSDASCVPQGQEPGLSESQCNDAFGCETVCSTGSGWYFDPIVGCPCQYADCVPEGSTAYGSLLECHQNENSGQCLEIQM